MNDIRTGDEEDMKRHANIMFDLGLSRVFLASIDAFAIFRMCTPSVCVKTAKTGAVINERDQII